MAETEPFDVYADQFSFSVGVYGVTFLLQRSPAAPKPGQAANETVGVVRMSLEHTKVFSMLIRRQLKMYEEENGTPIQIPQKVMNDLGLSEEDWNKI